MSIGHPEALTTFVLRDGVKFNRAIEVDTEARWALAYAHSEDFTPQELIGLAKINIVPGSGGLLVNHSIGDYVRIKLTGNFELGKL